MNRVSKKITGAQYIYNCLVKQNVKHTWMYSGSSIMPLIDCFKDNKIKHYIPTSEQNAGHAATGYAKSTNETGVVITTSGSGITNMITPMLDAQNDSTPLVVISGQVPINEMGKDECQKVPSTEITKPFTKWSHCVKYPNQLKDIIKTAFFIANNKKKGVVHIDLPKCILNTPVSFVEDIVRIEFKNPYIRTNIDQNVIDAINNAKKPIIIVGQGAKHASKELLDLVEKTSIPCTSTIHGKGIFPDSHPLSLKWCGMRGLPAANIAIQQSDCIIVIGSRFDDRIIGVPTQYAPIAREKGNIIHVDIDNKQFCKTIESNYNIQSDAKEFMKTIIHSLEHNERKEWVERVKTCKEKHSFKNKESKFLTVPYAIKSINNVIKKRRNVSITTGVGDHQMMTYQYIDTEIPNVIHSSGSLGVMGSGLGYAQGVQIGNPTNLVINIDGDSSFLMTGCDLKTIKENNLPIKIAIMNDSNHIETLNKRNPLFTNFAEAFGIQTFRCINKNTCDRITNAFLSYPGPALCEYSVDSEICLPLVSPGLALDNIITFDNYYKAKIDLDPHYIPS